MSGSAAPAYVHTATSASARKRGAPVARGSKAGDGRKGRGGHDDRRDRRPRPTVAPGTFYNYFTTREEILDAVAASLVEEFRRVMAAIQRTVDDPAERIPSPFACSSSARGTDTLWGWFMARYAPSLPILRDQTRDIIRERIVKEGLARKRFRLPTTRAIGDLITGTTVTALRSILEGRLSLDVAGEVAELCCAASALPLAEAHDIAIRPIPSLGASSAGHQRCRGAQGSS